MGVGGGGVEEPAILKLGGLCVQALLCPQGPGGVTPGLPVGFSFRAAEARWGGRGDLIPAAKTATAESVCVGKERASPLGSQKSPSA